jgi:DNA mismatch repair protein MutS
MVLMDDITIKNLELFSSSYEANEKYSLIGILDQTVTTGGARYLRYLLTNPIHTLPLLQERHRHIARYQQHPHAKLLLKQLNENFDIHKLLSTILYKKLNPTPFLKLRTTLGVFFATTPLMNGEMMKQELVKLGMDEQELQQLFHLWKLLQQALKADEEIKLEMDYIQDCYNEEVDRLRKIAYHSDELLLEYQQFLVKQTGITNVKLKFVMNQGYFIEVTTRDMPAFEKRISENLETENFRELQHKDNQREVLTNSQKFSEDNSQKFSLTRRQTLKDNQRYSSPYLEEIQQSILSSKDELVKLEFSLLGKLAQEVAKVAEALSTFAQKIAELDVYCSHALFALEQNYIQPELNATSIIAIEGGRHPVIEAYLPRDQQFIPNDLTLGNQFAPNGMLEQDNGLIHIIT